MSKTAREMRAERVGNMEQMARAAFAEHQIFECGDRWWHIAKVTGPGKRASHYATDIFCGMWGEILVGGDISTCCFAYYSDTADPIDRLRWIGRQHELDAYVLEKASIGLTDSRKLVMDFDSDLAAQEIREWVEQLVEDGVDPRHIDRDDWENFAQQAAGGEISQDALYHEMYWALPWEQLEGLDGIGSIVSSRVVYAHAAIRRLCELLEDR